VSPRTLYKASACSIQALVDTTVDALSKLSFDTINKILVNLVKLKGNSRDNDSASGFGTPDDKSTFLKCLKAAQRQTGKTSKNRPMVTNIFAEENRMER
jgi:hypothetical protein